MLAQLYAGSWARGALAAVVSAVAAPPPGWRSPWPPAPGCRPPARRDWGAAVAGVVPKGAALALAIGVPAAAGAAGACLGGYDGARAAFAVAAGAGGAEVLLRRCLRRFGGVTGDVFGAVAETAAVTALVVLALGR